MLDTQDSCFDMLSPRRVAYGDRMSGGYVPYFTARGELVEP